MGCQWSERTGYRGGQHGHPAATPRRGLSGWQERLQGFPELLTDDFSCHAAYVGVGIIRINSVLLAALSSIQTASIWETMPLKEQSKHY